MFIVYLVKSLENIALYVFLGLVCFCSATNLGFTLTSISLVQLTAVSNNVFIANCFL